ncbi:MAG: substrate-binding domain-containing protein [Lachnospiraceae bacterium]|nr:substrate-binding domain-containing protein [Lachnospiraceae bacterium]
MEKKGYVGIIVLLAAVFAVIFFSVNDSYYRRVLQLQGLEEEAGEACDYHFTMIVDNAESSFWRAAYESGSQAAQENKVLLELKGTGPDTRYDKIDYMNISIASQVDGIIVENNGEEGLAEKIDEAVEAGIPVVTVMSDASYSKRQSFVGVSDYQLGQAYAEQAALYADEDVKDILIVMNRLTDEKSQSQFYSQVYNAVSGKSDGTGQQVNVSIQNLLLIGSFDAEEAIRDIFQRKAGPPDMLICMDEETTECARQALIDYNMAGGVRIIGCYASDNTVDAITKGLIKTTCSIDTKQLGSRSVEALLDYKKEGRVNSYYNVDIHFVDEEEAAMLQRRRHNEKISLE